MRIVRVGAALAVAAVAVAAPGAFATDVAPPAVTIDQGDYAVMIGGPVPGWGASGTASDDVAVSRVRVTFCGNAARYPGGGWSCGTGIGGVSKVVASDATLTCPATRQSCTWTAAAPLQPDDYLVFAKAFDSSGNTTYAGPVYVTVV